jgi:hypothetical protein
MFCKEKLICCSNMKLSEWLSLLVDICWHCCQQALSSAFEIKAGSGKEHRFSSKMIRASLEINIGKGLG